MMTDEPDPAAARDLTDRTAEPPPGPSPSRSATADPTPAAQVPGAGTLAVLASAWLLAMLSSARLAIGSISQATPLAVTRAALELPQVISASLIAGISVGLAAVSLGSRFAPTALARPLPRYGLGAGSGLFTGLAVGTPVQLEYGVLPSILVLSGAVAGAAALGGLFAGSRHRVVVAAGVTGALGAFVVGLAERAFEDDLRTLFGAGESAESIVNASDWLVLTGSLVAGVVAGVASYVYLRRCGPAGLRWPVYLLAGAMPGTFVLLAEVVTRLGGARLFHLVSTASVDDQAILSYFGEARIDRALVLLFTGALVAILLLGRTLRPAAENAATGAAAGEAGPGTPAGPDSG